MFPRSCVQTVQTRQKWLREGLQIRENEIPSKVICIGLWKTIKFLIYYNLYQSVESCRVFLFFFFQVIKRSKKTENDEISDAGFAEEDREKSIELFGRWQVEPLQLPHAVNGIVPKVR